MSPEDQQVVTTTKSLSPEEWLAQRRSTTPAAKLPSPEDQQVVTTTKSLSPEEWMAQRKPAPAEEPSEGGGYLGALTRGTSPYALAAAAGAAGGATFAGVGAIPGASAGVGAMALMDLGLNVYNMVGPAIGLPQAPTPNALTDAMLDKLGVPRATTPGQKLVQAGTEGAMSGLSVPLAAANMAGRVTSPAVRNVLQTLAEGPIKQTLSGAASGTAAEALSGMGPWGQMLGATAAGLIPYAAGGGRSIVGAVRHPIDTLRKSISPEATPKEVTAAYGRLFGKAPTAEPSRTVAAGLGKTAEQVRAETAQRVGEVTQPAQAAVTQAKQAEQTALMNASHIREVGEAAAELERINRMREMTGKRQSASAMDSVVRGRAADLAQKGQAIGSPVEPTDSGEAIRHTVEKVQTAREDAVKAQYGADMRERDQIVAAKEAAGQTISGTKKFAELEKFIDDMILKGSALRKAKLAPVTDPARLSAFEQVLSSIKGRRITVSADEAKAIEAAGGKIVTGRNPMTGETILQREFPSSFAALDDIRRRVAKVANFGGEVEGYAGIAGNDAKDLYKRLSEIQREFVDGETKGIQSKMQENYAEGKRGQIIYDSKTGRAALEAQKGDPEAFLRQAAELPGVYFRNRGTVTDLIKQTGGNTQFVEGIARGHVSKQLSGLANEGVQSWVKANSDWLSKFPSLQRDVQAHAAASSKFADIKPRLTEEARRLRGELNKIDPEKRAAEVRATAQAKAQDVEKTAVQAREAAEKGLKAATASASEMQAAGDKVAQLLSVDPKNAPEFMSKLIGKDFSDEQLGHITQAIKNDPAALKAFPDAVSQALAGIPAGKTPRGVMNIRAAWDGGVKQMLEGTGLMNREQIAGLESKIADIDRHASANERHRMVSYVIRAAIISAQAAAATQRANRAEGQ